MSDISLLTFKIKHNFNFKDELHKAFQIAQFCIGKIKLSSKDVKHFNLKAAISCQIIRKYCKPNIKRIKSVKLIIPGQHLKYKDNNIYISCLKLNIKFNHNVLKVNFIEIDNNYFYICCTVLNKTSFDTDTYLGVDLNSTSHLAVVANKTKITKLGKKSSFVKKKYKNLRSRAQHKKQYKKVKSLGRRESAIIKDINHKISRYLVDLAYRTKQGIKLEDLKGIRSSRKKSKDINHTLHSWSFYQLKTFIDYKAKLLGVPIIYVNPCMTSQTCSKCSCIGTRSKKLFVCTDCGHTDHADSNAAFNIAKGFPKKLTNTILSI